MFKMGEGVSLHCFCASNPGRFGYNRSLGYGLGVIWNGAGMSAKAQGESGFTLLEVMVALAVFAAASTLILPRMQGLLDYAHRIEGVFAETSILRNDINLFSLRDPKHDQIRVVGDHLEVRVEELATSPVEVYNFSANEINLPVGMGVSPTQTYRWTTANGHSASLLMPGIPRSRVE